MGVDFDFKRHLNETKLTASLYDQPVNELDLMTESTEGVELQAILNILNLIQGRLRDRFQATEHLVSLMIEMNEDRRLFITFMGRGLEQQRPIINRTIPIIQSPPVPTQRLWREREEREQAQMHRNLSRGRNRSILFEPIIPEAQQNIVREVQGLEFYQNRPVLTESESMSMEMNQREYFDDNLHFQPLRSMPNLAIQRRDSENFLQINENYQEREDRRQVGSNKMQQRQQIPKKQHQQQVGQENDETTNEIHLNQNSQIGIKPKIKKQEENIEEPGTCWQFLSRMVRNFINIFR